MRRCQILGLVTAALAWLGGAALAADVTVFAAASLTNALQDIGRAYEQTTPSRVTFSFASSSTLAKQIEAGASADIVISADDAWMTYLAAKKAIKQETRAALLSNRLVVVVPTNNAIALDIKADGSWLGALPAGRIATGDPSHVPVGTYAQQALTKLGAWAAIEPRLARADNVRSALILVERGEAAAGIVYATDAAVSKGVRVAGFIPAEAHEPIRYPMAIVTGSKSADAERFFAFLTSPAAKSIFTRFGFITR